MAKRLVSKRIEGQDANEKSKNPVRVKNTLHRPGCCVICGHGNDIPERTYINTGREIKRYGIIYVCDYCVEVCGQMFGYPTVADIEAVTEKANTAETQVAELTAKLETAENDVTALRTLLREELTETE